MTELSHDLAEADLTELFGLPEESGWQERALCAQTDPEAFFPEKGGSTREAKKICVGCEVKAECLEYALEHDERFGIWGGLSERERRRLKRRASLTSAAPSCRVSAGCGRSRPPSNAEPGTRLSWSRSASFQPRQVAPQRNQFEPLSATNMPYFFRRPG